MILVRRGHAAEAGGLLAQAQMLREAGVPAFRLGWIDWAQALTEEAAGDHDRARERMWAAWSDVTSRGILGEQRTLAPDLARLLAAADEGGRLREVTAAIEQLARRNPELRSLQALAERCRGLAEEDHHGLLRACEVWPEQSRPHERALALEDATVALAADGDRARARRLADQTLDIYSALGAAQDAARATGRFRAGGLRPGARGTRQRELRGWGSLTPSERRVAELAAAGLSNPQIADRLVISRHTVATHITHILAKLELRSRYELATAQPPG